MSLLQPLLPLLILQLRQLQLQIPASSQKTVREEEKIRKGYFDSGTEVRASMLMAFTPFSISVASLTVDTINSLFFVDDDDDDDYYYYYYCCLYFCQAL